LQFELCGHPELRILCHDNCFSLQGANVFDSTAADATSGLWPVFRCLTNTLTVRLDFIKCTCHMSLKQAGSNVCVNNCQLEFTCRQQAEHRTPQDNYRVRSDPSFDVESRRAGEGRFQSVDSSRCCLG
jgi:hypothetical protein